MRTLRQCKDKSMDGDLTPSKHLPPEINSMEEDIKQRARLHSSGTVNAPFMNYASCTPL